MMKKCWGSSHLSTWDSLEVLNDTRALSKATEAAGHQRVADRQTDSELHVKGSFLFKLKITLKHTPPPPPHEKMPSPSLCGEILSPPEDIHVATSILLQMFLFHFFHTLQTARAQA